MNEMNTTPYVLVLFDSHKNATRDLAYLIAQGVNDAGMAVRVRCVPKVSAVSEQVAPSVPEAGELYCTAADLAGCAGLALGSPVYFGNMSANMKYFWDNTVTLWLAGELQGKPACVFGSSGSMHGGQESTLLTMMLPLLHHGMLLVGLPYAHPELSSTVHGGTPYGATAVTGARHDLMLSDDEKRLAIAQGVRLAQVAQKLL